jgi:hypothetical protein
MAIITLNNNSLSSVTSLPAAIATGKVVGFSTASQGSSFETNSSTFTDVTGLSLSYTMQNSSNKIFFTVLGSTQRGSQDGGTGSQLVFDGSAVFESKIEDPSCADDTFYPYGSAIIDGYSGAKTFKAQIRSTPNNSKCISRNGSTLMVMEIE